MPEKSLIQTLSFFPFSFRGWINFLSCAQLRHCKICAACGIIGESCPPPPQGATFFRGDNTDFTEQRLREIEDRLDHAEEVEEELSALKRKLEQFSETISHQPLVMFSCIHCKKKDECRKKSEQGQPALLMRIEEDFLGENPVYELSCRLECGDVRSINIPDVQL